MEPILVELVGQAWWQCLLPVIALFISLASIALTLILRFRDDARIAVTSNLSVFVRRSKRPAAYQSHGDQCRPHRKNGTHFAPSQDSKGGQPSHAETSRWSYHAASHARTRGLGAPVHFCLGGPALYEGGGPRSHEARGGRLYRPWRTCLRTQQAGTSSLGSMS